ncbi:MAG TPA: peroxiredoxin family protein [Chthoniobacteraceae bacterium]|jgi:peroxiredoxin|nr:peroxiredoxin family protein [Chthoniobacteraceae bacterium]
MNRSSFLRSLLALAALFSAGLVHAADPAPTALVVGQQAPDFKIRDSSGNEINLADLTAKGPVLVRLTCGCLGCNKELSYFQELHAAYKEKGLTSLAIFREPDAKVEAYVKEKKLDMRYATDSKGESWKVFQTKTMPSNFLIEKGGKIAAISTGCDTSGLLASRLSDKAALLVGAEKVDVRAKVNEASPAPPQAK